MASGAFLEIGIVVLRSILIVAGHSL